MFYRFPARKQPEKGVDGLVRRRKKEGLGTILSSIFRMPASGFYTDALVHISSSGEIQVDNSKGIRLYDETAVELDMGKTVMRITGDALVLETVEKGIILVRGKIFGINFLYSQEGEQTRGEKMSVGRSERRG